MEAKKYGLPLIFKAVNVETGEEWEQDYPYMIYSGTKVHKIRLKPHHANIALLQQTGFKDASGKEVYFGDVITLPKLVSKNIGFAIVQFYIESEYDDRIKAITPCGGWACDSHAFKKAHIVGNAYEPPARWLERAREIWPDAQLPELAEGVQHGA